MKVYFVSTLKLGLVVLASKLFEKSQELLGNTRVKPYAEEDMITEDQG